MSKIQQAKNIGFSLLCTVALILYAWVWLWIAMIADEQPW